MSNLKCAEASDETNKNSSESDSSELQPTQNLLPAIIEMENIDTIKLETASIRTTESIYMCRICHLETRTSNTFIRPCNCSGTISNVHEKCLQKWVMLKNKRTCELCKCEFKIEKRLNSIQNWTMSGIKMNQHEKLRFYLINFFYLIGLLCNVLALVTLLSGVIRKFNTKSFDIEFLLYLIFIVFVSFCILWSLVSLLHIWINLFVNFIRTNQSIVILSAK
ncbi:unnamed protein product [Brachionus calyciflorus]|uniref:Uncharacterized protein n=1 Tax=Brachionus calyciflorus TaxID=104777 RepID=A0A813QXI7_9BILA|nr:unnamed protein product [Brachionus calyciflorus]